MTPGITLAIGLAVTVLFRASLATNYVVLGDDTFGYLSGSGSHFLALPYLWPFTTLMGEFPGVKMAAIVASIAPAIPFYLLLRDRPGGGWVAALGAWALVWVPVYGWVLGWGFLSLLAVTAGLFCVLGMHRYYATGRFAWAIAAFFGGSAAVLLNQSALLVLAPLVLVYVLASVWRRPRLMWGYGPLGVFALVFVPSLEWQAFHVGLSSAWTVAALSVLAVGFVLGGRKVGGSYGILIAVWGLAAVIPQMFTSADLDAMVAFGRAGLWMYPPLLMLGAEGFGALRGRAFLVGAPLALVGLAVLSILWGLSFERSAQASSNLTDDTVEVFLWLQENAPGELVAVVPHGLGWALSYTTGRPYMTTVPEIVRGQIRDRLESEYVDCLVAGGCQMRSPVAAGAPAYLVVNHGLASLPLVKSVGSVRVYRVAPN
ncbi:MAG: hypothetical protein V3S00_01215 [Dehalococcoidia bacterium]